MGKCMNCGKAGCEIADGLHLCSSCEAVIYCKKSSNNTRSENTSVKKQNASIN